MMNGHFTDIRQVFEILNANSVKYLVLRNYDNLLSPELYVDGHGDIDILCEDSMQIARLLGAYTNRKDIPPFKGDGVHFFVYINGVPASLDLRYIGDGYYCTTWEKQMLDNRVSNDCFYIMDREDYFYSLIYHAILQKRTFSEDYRKRLEAMAIDLTITIPSYNQDGFLRVLEDYMRSKGFSFTYSKDWLVPNRFNLVSKDLVCNNRKLWWFHWKFDIKISIIEILVKIKHIIRGK